MAYPTVFSPIQIGPVKVPNRLYITGHGTGFGVERDGIVLPSERHAYYHRERARGGIGLIIFGGTAVHPSCSAKPLKTEDVWDERSIPGLQLVADMVHAEGVPIFLQLCHLGQHGNPGGDPGSRLPSLCSSDTPAVEAYRTPRAMDKTMIREAIQFLARSACNARSAGWDGVELHATHSYLAQQFLSPYYNRRTDEYGGSLANRMRFMVEVLAEMRDITRGELAVGARICADEMLPGGMSLEDMQEVARRLEEQGLVDYLDVDIGTYHTAPLMCTPMQIEPHHSLAYIAAIKAALAKTPVLGCPGRFGSPAAAEVMLTEGKMDMVGGTRALIADPFLPKKAQEGRAEDIRPCIACNDYCAGYIMQGLGITCAVNPAVGREREWGEASLRPATKPKTIVVVGGGPAGMEAARAAAQRGHRVTLYEKDDDLGGHMRQLAQLPGRQAYVEIIAWFRPQLEQLKVKVRTAHPFSAGDVDDEVDAVVVATGARYRPDGVTGLIARPIPGWDQDHVFTPERALANIERIKGRVVVLDEEGYMMGPGLAQMLAERGLPVEYVTRWPSIAPRLLGNMQSSVVYPALYANGVRLTINHHIKGIDERQVTLFNIYTSEENIVEAVGAVILVANKQAIDDLAREIAGQGCAVHVIGDALAPRGLGEAVMDGHAAARGL